VNRLHLLVPTACPVVSWGVAWCRPLREFRGGRYRGTATRIRLPTVAATASTIVVALCGEVRGGGLMYYVGEETQYNFGRRRRPSNGTLSGRLRAFRRARNPDGTRWRVTVNEGMCGCISHLRKIGHPETGELPLLVTSRTENAISQAICRSELKPPQYHQRVRNAAREASTVWRTQAKTGATPRFAS